MPNYYIRLTPSDKIKELRKLRNYTQESLAQVLGCTKTKISRAESGEHEYSDEEIVKLKVFFDIKNAPFTEIEHISFKQQLYNWKDLIRNGYTEVARRNQSEHSVVSKLPFEPELSMLYKMFEIRLILKESKPDLAEEMLMAEKAHIENASRENQHHFYYNMGSVHLYRHDFKRALRCYKKALDLEGYTLKKDIGLYLNLSMCYGELGKYVMAISILEKTFQEFSSQICLMSGYINNLLGINYVRIGQTTRAKQLFDKSLLEIANGDHKLYSYMTLHNYGCAHFREKNYEKAIERFDEALASYDKVDRNYFENMYYRVRCYIALKNTSKAQHLIVQTMNLLEGNERYLLAFESLSRLLTIKNDISIEFIEKNTIPYFIEKREYFKALDYCEQLESVFSKREKGFKIRLLEISSTARDILQDMTLGEEVSD